MTVTAVVSDLDGTLLDSTGTLSKDALAAIASLRAHGIEFVCATGRTPRAIRRIAGHEWLGRIVCANGAVVWDATTNTIVDRVTFSRDALVSAIASMRQTLPDAGWAVLTPDVMHLDHIYALCRPKGSKGAVLVDEVCDAIADHEAVAVALRMPGTPASSFLKLAAVGFAGTGTASIAGPHTVDIVPAGLDKAVTAARHLGELGHQRSGTVAFGDMPNDLPLFAWAGYAFAVANGHPDVLAAANEIIPSNDDDGVALTLSQLIAGNRDQVRRQG